MGILGLAQPLRAGHLCSNCFTQGTQISLPPRYPVPTGTVTVFTQVPLKPKVQMLPGRVS